MHRIDSAFAIAGCARAAVLIMLAACAADATAVDDDPAIGDGKADDGASRVPWSVSRHAWPSDDRALVTRDFELIAELGARYVRTDVWWYAVQPSAGQFDDDALAFYRWYVEEAARHGLGVVTILSNAPEWARGLDRAQLAAAFGAYSERVALTLGDLVTYWQLWNEPNHFNDFPDGDTDVALFDAGRRGLERATTRPIRTIVNVLVDGHDSPIGPRWEDDVRFYLARTNAIDIIAIDHYPGTWSIGDWGGNILDRLFALGKQHGKSVAIFEAGYATAHCTLVFNTEANQAGWIREQVPRIRAKLRDPQVTRGVRFELANWFRIDDRNTGNCFDPEDNFGLVRTNRSKKPAFDALRSEIAAF